MELKRRQAVVDNDFLSHMTEIESIDSYDLICRCCNAVSVDPIMHGLVYDKEAMKDHVVTKKLISNSILAIIYFESFLPSSAETVYYEILVEELYYRLKGKEINLDNIFTDWRSKDSLGEIHSISMCIVIKCDIFLSDDSDSKEIQRLATNSTKMIKEIRILNREDVCAELELLPEKSISGSERRIICHRPT